MSKKKITLLRFQNTRVTVFCFINIALQRFFQRYMLPTRNHPFFKFDQTKGKNYCKCKFSFISYKILHNQYFTNNIYTEQHILIACVYIILSCSSLYMYIHLSRTSLLGK